MLGSAAREGLAVGFQEFHMHEASARSTVSAVEDAKLLCRKRCWFRNHLVGLGWSLSEPEIQEYHLSILEQSSKPRWMITLWG